MSNEQRSPHTTGGGGMEFLDVNTRVVVMLVVFG